MAFFYNPGLPVHTTLPNELSVQCEVGIPEKEYYAISLNWSQDAQPPKAYYDLARRAGAVLTGESPSVLSEASRQCHERALAFAGELADPKAKIECQAFKRSGGGAFVSIWVRTPRDQETR